MLATQMKTPNRESLELRMLDIERAIDAAVRRNFSKKSCHKLTLHLNELLGLILEEGEDMPVKIDDENAPTSKAMIMIDIAFVCWMNDEPAIPLPDDTIVNHTMRMRFNPGHCKFTLKLARMHLKKYGKLLSVEAWSLLIP